MHKYTCGKHYGDVESGQLKRGCYRWSNVRYHGVWFSASPGIFRVRCDLFDRILLPKTHPCRNPVSLFSTSCPRGKDVYLNELRIPCAKELSLKIGVLGKFVE